MLSSSGGVRENLSIRSRILSSSKREVLDGVGLLGISGFIELSCGAGFGAGGGSQALLRSNRIKMGIKRFIGVSNILRRGYAVSPSAEKNYEHKWNNSSLQRKNPR